MPLIMNADGGSLNGLAPRACDLMMQLCRCDNMRVRFIFDSEGPGCLRLYEVVRDHW